MNDDDSRAYSVVVPIYNEERSCGWFLEELAAVLQNAATPAELIVVDDGSTDRSPEIMIASLRDYPSAIIERLMPNQGKGAAIRRGLDKVSHDRVVFIDGDGAFPSSAVPGCASLLETADVVLGLKRGYPLFRRLISTAFNAYVALLFSLPTSDVFCGLKAFRTSVARELFGACEQNGWLLDIEMLRRMPDTLTVTLFPVEVRENPGSKFRFSDPIRIALQLMLWRIRS